MSQPFTADQVLINLLNSMNFLHFTRNSDLNAELPDPQWWTIKQYAFCTEMVGDPDHWIHHYVKMYLSTNNYSGNGMGMTLMEMWWNGKKTREWGL